MSHQRKPSTTRASRLAVAVTTITAAVAGVGLAVLAGTTLAKAFSLEVGKNAMVTNQAHQSVHENIVVNSKGRAVYWLSGDSERHPECTMANHCFSFWPPVKVASMSSLSKAPGVPGKLGIWHHDGFDQVTLGGHPLYTYSYDMAMDQANGQGAVGFGGTWSVIKAAASGGSGGPTTTTTTTSSPTTTTTTSTTSTTSTSTYPGPPGPPGPPPPPWG